MNFETIKFYFLSVFGISILEVSEAVQTITQLDSLFSTIFQFLIGGLTIYKLTTDILKKNKRDKRNKYLDEKVKKLLEHKDD
jgi:hypothetical protein